jgi:hypothetical protein
MNVMNDFLDFFQSTLRNHRINVDERLSATCSSQRNLEAIPLVNEERKSEPLTGQGSGE